MSKARQSKRQRYRKPRADYQAGGRVELNGGGEVIGGGQGRGMRGVNAISAKLPDTVTEK